MNKLFKTGITSVVMAGTLLAGIPVSSSVSAGAVTESNVNKTGFTFHRDIGCFVDQ